ncbi:hypothetical protein [Bradyrhizobium sp. CCBAU 51627]|uniref:hypothetical protein n=1 Tax=Bradyrhizobium sp. CCBAU 51627 TaxID=1325088 RepID=UPI002305F4CF|nr:hypothetical protein [Bradyrhizobium sp. CCBAU 51627]
MMMIDCAALVTRLPIGRVFREISAMGPSATPSPIDKSARAPFKIVHQSRKRARGCVAKQRDHRAWFPRTKTEMQNSTRVNIKKKQEFA